MGQSDLHVWPALLWAEQPHFSSAFNLGGHTCNFYFILYGGTQNYDEVQSLYGSMYINILAFVYL